jgi:riboflavin synthase
VFTGIIQSLGSVRRLTRSGADAVIAVDAPGLDLDRTAVGDSIAVNGVCLTAVALRDGGFEADVSGETLSRTTLGALSAGDRVNLEQALLPTTRLGGHLVSGHVDGVGRVASRGDDGRSLRFALEVPENLARYIAEKGSVCVDGVSLTVNRVEGARFAVNIVPHTASHTTFGMYRIGDRVNIEVDVLARYLERLLAGGSPAQGVDVEKLRRAGFMPGASGED